jgi:hypothetical protein
LTDLEFSPEGLLLFAERTQADFKFPGAHQSRVFEAKRAGSGWVATSSSAPPKFQIGAYPSKANASGGVDYDCLTNNECNLGGRHVMATGDYLLGSPYVKRSFTCLGSGQAKLIFSFKSLAPWGTSGHLFLDPTAPLSGGVPLVTANPDYFPLNLAYGGTYTNSTILSGALLHGTEVCLDFTIHNPSLELCCSQQLCLPWPCFIDP